MRSEAEARIYELLNTKIDELLDFENFNWLMSESQGIASDYMKLLLSFLKSNLDSFNHLPVSFKLQIQISSSNKNENIINTILNILFFKNHYLYIIFKFNLCWSTILI